MYPAHKPGVPDPRSILVVLPTWVGDFVMATPALRAVRTRFPNARITFLAEPNLRDLIDGGNWMDEVVEWPAKRDRSPWRKPYRRLVRRLCECQFDWAIVLPNSFRSALIARMSGAKRRIGYDRDGRGFLLTDRIPVKNRTARARRVGPVARASGSDSVTGNSATEQGIRVTNVPLPPGYKGKYQPMPLVEWYADLAEAVGCERPGDKLEMFTTPACDTSLGEKLAASNAADHHPLVVLCPGAKYGAAKCWFTDRFAAVADRLIEQQRATVVITCGPGEEDIARRIGAAMHRSPIVFDDPRLTLGELKSLIHRADLLICNDAGPRHFAKAFNVPVVTIFGPTHPDWTATSFQAERIVRIDIECGPCQQRVCPLGHLDCMRGVTVGAVYEAARALLGTGVAVRPAGVAHD